MNWLQRTVVAAAIAAAGGAGAAETQAHTGSRNVVVPNVSLRCPAGTVQAGGFDSSLEVTTCLKKGTRVSHGPYVHQWANGNVRARGQFDNGFRTGTWEYFNEDGSKAAEINFSRGNYDGRKVEFHANGRVKTEETWVKGKRQGFVREFDAKGNAVSVKEYRDDRAVATR